MPTPITPEQLQQRMLEAAPYALIDVREVGEYNASHIPGSSLIPRGRLEFELAQAVPHPDTTLILCDDDARRVIRAAAADAAYILDQFPVLEKNERREHNRYLTKELVLGHYRALAAGDTTSDIAV